jgi:hypothetical protein
MRKLFANRFTVTTMIATGAIYYVQGSTGAGHFCELFAVILWLFGGRPRLWPRKPEPETIGNGIARAVVRRSKRTHRSDLTAKYAQLDPAWQDWLSSPANNPRPSKQGQ